MSMVTTSNNNNITRIKLHLYCIKFTITLQQLELQQPVFVDFFKFITFQRN